MTEAKPTLFSPIQDTTISNEEIANITVSSSIGRNKLLLRWHFFEPLFEHNEHLELLEEIRVVTSNVALQAELVQSWENEIIQHNGAFAILLRDVRHASLYLELATAAEEDQNRERAWAFNNHATMIVGGILEKINTRLNEMEIDKVSKQNSKNAMEGNKFILPAKEKAAKLLVEMRPEAGWPSKVNVYVAFEKPLAEFIKKNKIPRIRVSNIENWLGDWLREDKLVAPAWEKNKNHSIK